MYLLYKLIRGTVAVNIFIGVVVFFALYWLVNVLELELLKILLGSFVSFGIIILVIIFQPELRRFLLMLGDSTVSNNIGVKFLEKILNQKANISTSSHEISDIVTTGLSILSKEQMGALIVLSKNDLIEISESGTYIGGQLSSALLESLFYKNSALHDGAVIINHKIIVAAGCILPLSANADLPKELGLRHRAAIGISEQMDVLAIVVSEETGALSIAQNGKWKLNLHTLEIKNEINKFLSA